MCVAILKPADSKLDVELLLDMWVSNPDGGGFAYAADGRLEVQKGFMTFGEFWSAFEEVNNAAVPAIVHFRWATHGLKDQANTHPFKVSDDMAVVHNGIISQHSIGGWNSKEKKSDTWLFVEEILQGLEKITPDFTDNKTLMTMVEDYIGYGNKLIFLDAAGRFTIANEDCGTWHEGSWYSNSSCLPGRTSYYRMDTTVYADAASERFAFCDAGLGSATFGDAAWEDEINGRLDGYIGDGKETDEQMYKRWIREDDARQGTTSDAPSDACSNCLMPEPVDELHYIADDDTGAAILLCDECVESTDGKEIMDAFGKAPIDAKRGARWQYPQGVPSPAKSSKAPLKLAKHTKKKNGAKKVSKRQSKNQRRIARSA